MQKKMILIGLMICLPGSSRVREVENLGTPSVNPTVQLAIFAIIDCKHHLRLRPYILFPKMSYSTDQPRG